MAVKWILSCVLLMAPLEAEHTPYVVKESEKPLQAYLCARVSEDSKVYNNHIAFLLEEGVVVFKPQEVAQEPPIYKKDITCMEKADFLLLLPPYGKDCAFEVGWFVAKNKPTILYAEKGGEWQRDVMVKGGLTWVVTTSKPLYENLLKDEELEGKVTFLSSEQELKAKVISLVKKGPSRN